jgi:hypothetical protein
MRVLRRIIKAFEKGRQDLVRCEIPDISILTPEGQMQMQQMQRIAHRIVAPHRRDMR